MKKSLLTATEIVVIAGIWILSLEGAIQLIGAKVGIAATITVWICAYILAKIEETKAVMEVTIISKDGTKDKISGERIMDTESGILVFRSESEMVAITREEVKSVFIRAKKEV